VIFGHDAIKGIQRNQFSTGLDSGCVYGGPLSACVIPAGKIINSRSLKDFVPTAENLEIKVVSVKENVH